LCPLILIHSFNKNLISYLERKTKQTKKKKQANNQTMSESIRNGLNSIAANFDRPGAMSGNYGPSEFFQANGIVAKLVFVFLVLIAFIVLLKIGVFFLAWLLMPADSPYIVYGLMNGNKPLVFEQDDKSDTSILIKRSNNQTTGMEFTWSVWLNIDAAPSYNSNDNDRVYYHVFNKGNPHTGQNVTGQQFAGPTSSSSVPLAQIESPGLYIRTTTLTSTDTSVPTDTNAKTLELVVKMTKYWDGGNTTSSSGTSTTTPASTLEEISVGTIPLKKWIHVAIRLENTIMDVYVNGTITQRKIFDGDYPMQSFGRVYVCQNGGFVGNLSNLRYYNYALSVFDIQNLVYWGPNLLPSKYSRDNMYFSNSNFFFDSSWYASRY
jgi:phage shock protein PspC (stress-responsive transcriptional regulator)